jgi:hypothetical protein
MVLASHINSLLSKDMHNTKRVAVFFAYALWSEWGEDVLKESYECLGIEHEEEEGTRRRKKKP